MNFEWSNRAEKVEKSFIREILKVVNKPSIISFAGGLPNPSFFPVEELKEASRLVFEEEGEKALQYSLTEGCEDLRRFISDRYKKKGIDIGYKEILITSGSQQGLDLLGKVFINKGDNILMEKPGYLGAIQSFSAYEPNIDMVKLTNEGIDLTELEEKLKKNKYKFFYGVPNFQNPTGISYSAQNRVEVTKLLRKYKVPYIEDNPYGEIRFMGEEQESFGKLYKEGTIVLGSFSKIVTPAFRIGYISGPKEVVDKLVTFKQGSDLHTNYFSQRVLYKYLSTFDLGSHINKIKEQYRIQREVMVEEIKNNLPKEFKITLPEGGMFLWVEVPKVFDIDSYFQRALDKGVAFVTGLPFYIDKKEVSGFRLNYSNSKPEEIREGIKRLKEAL